MKKKNKLLCEVKGCYGEYDTRYYGHTICRKHILMQQNGTFNLKKHFKIPEPTHSTFLPKESQKPLTEPIRTLKNTIKQKRLI